MVAEENPFIRRDEVAPVVVALAGSSAGVIQGENFGGDECRIEPVRHQITADSGYHEPCRVERLAAMQGDRAESAGAKRGYGNPDCDAEESFHFVGFAAVLDLMNCAMSALSFANEGGCTYIMWPAS